MRILITGATGFLGNNLARGLIKHQHQVLAGIRGTSAMQSLEGLDVERVDLDFEDPASLAAAVSDADAVVHAAALIQLGWSQLEASRRVNVEYSVRLAQAARRRGIRMIHVSSVDALGLGSPDRPADEQQLDPPNPACSYVVSKREAESAFLLEVADGLDGVIVNPGFMVGPNDWRPSSGEMMLSLFKNLIYFAPAGGCSVVDVRDVADGILAALQFGRSGQRYILAGHNLTYMDLWTRMAKVMECRPPRRNLPDWIARAAGRVGDLAGRLSKQEKAVNSAATEMGQLFHWYSSDKARTELGYQYGPVDDALHDAWDWFVQHGYVKPKAKSRIPGQA